MFYSERVSAAAPLQQNVSGKYFLIESAGDAGEVAVTLLRGGAPIFGRIPAAKRGHKYGVEGGFDGVRIEAASDTEVRFFATFENVSISTTDGAQVEIPGGVVITNTGESPVPVEFTGVVNLTADSVVVDQKAAAVVGAAYVVTAAGVAVSTPANKDRRAIHFRNASATVDCYLAAFAAGNKNACPVILRAGECLLIDDRSATAAWVAYSDGADIPLKVQEVSE